MVYGLQAQSALDIPGVTSTSPEFHDMHMHLLINLSQAIIFYVAMQVCWILPS